MSLALYMRVKAFKGSRFSTIASGSLSEEKERGEVPLPAPSLHATDATDATDAMGASSASVMPAQSLSARAGTPQGGVHPCKRVHREVSFTRSGGEV